jgi:hypothetical protein
MKENEEITNLERFELLIEDCKGHRELYGEFSVGEYDIEIMQHIISEYKRVLKENEELKQEKINNYKMIALAQNEALGYMQGYEDGKKLKTSAIASILENQQYYIIQKQMEKYEEHIAKLQKENEELKVENSKMRNIELASKNGIVKVTLEGILDMEEKIKNSIPIQKVKDKIEELNDVSNAEKLEDIMNRKKYTITELFQYVLQELLEGRK